MLKGTDMIALRKIMREKSKEEELGELLTIEQQAAYQAILSTNWAPLEEQMIIYQAAANVLFPDDENPFEALGYALAQKTFTGLYRVFVRIPTLEFVLKRAAIVWTSFFSKGEATIVNLKKKQVDYVVTGIPELSQSMGYIVSGHCKVLAEITGRENVEVEFIDTNPEIWCWRLTWD
jgi:hypothetical protein